MLEVSNLSKRYGEKQAVDSISFCIEGNQVVGFLGINGAGKSTTMNILTGYLSASDGDVVIDGVDILTDPLKAKTKIGYLPEQPPVYPDMTVREYLRFIYDLKKVKKNKAIQKNQKEYLEQIMEEVGVLQVKDRIIRNLSKGYRQRVGLAQALIGDPQILILDEPTVGLDPAQIIEIRQLIRELAKTKTVIFSSHILSEVQAVCDRMIILHQGKIVADGNTQELAEHLSGSRQIEMEIEGNKKTICTVLEKISSVTKVTVKGKNNYTLSLADECTDTTAVRRQIFKTLSQAECIILSMSRRSLDLEEIFLRLTTGQEPQVVQEEAGKVPEKVQSEAQAEAQAEAREKTQEEIPADNQQEKIPQKEQQSVEEETKHDSNL